MAEPRQRDGNVRMKVGNRVGRAAELPRLFNVAVITCGQSKRLIFGGFCTTSLSAIYPTDFFHRQAFVKSVDTA